MIGIKAEVTMERTLYLDLPDDSSEEDILKASNEEIMLPINALNMASQALRHFNVNISKLDLKDWSVSNVKHEIIK